MTADRDTDPMTEAEAAAVPGAAPDARVRKPLSPAAQRALAEAAARRENAAAPASPEIQGRGGLDPVRYGDWEVKGIASDF